MALATNAFDKLQYFPEPHQLRDSEVEVVFPRDMDFSGEMTAFIWTVFPKATVTFAKHLIVVTDEESRDHSRLV